MAVRTSCRRLRLRRCMCTSPAATSGRPSALAQCREGFEPRRVVRPLVQLDRDPRPAGEARGEPASPPPPSAPIAGSHRASRPSVEAGKSSRARRYSPLGAARRARVIELAERFVAGERLREEDEPQPAGEAKLRADEEADAGILGREVRAHDAGDGALVGDGERRVAELGGAVDELLRDPRRRAGRCSWRRSAAPRSRAPWSAAPHAKTPCRYHAPGSRRSR